MYLGGAMSWLRPASVIPPIAVSWEGIDANVAAIVLTATPRNLRLAAYNFDDQPRRVRLRVWELEPGQYQVREGADTDHDDQIDGAPATREVHLERASTIELDLPPQHVHVVELEQTQAQPQPELLADLAVDDDDIFYDKATDRLKVVVHNLGAAAAEKVRVRFETAEGTFLGDQVIDRLEAPLDLSPKTAVVALPQPTLHPTSSITVRLDPEDQVPEITEENNLVRSLRERM
jgi:hypothetical protein